MQNTEKLVIYISFKNQLIRNIKEARFYTHTLRFMIQTPTATANEEACLVQVHCLLALVPDAFGTDHGIPS